MKIAVTGAGHFIGARLIEAFHLGGGPTLAAVVAHPAELTAAARFRIDLRFADFLQPDSLARSMSGCSALVHVAPLDHPAAKRVATSLCRGAALAAVRRLVLVSTAEVHGWNPRPGTDARSPLPAHPESPRLAALVAAERQFVAECRRQKLTVHVLRPGLVYGPRSPFTAALLREIAAGRAEPEPTAGLINGVYLDNVIAAVRLALKTKTPSASAFLITDAGALTWREFVAAFRSELNLPAAPPGAGEFPAASLFSDPAELAARLRCTWDAPRAATAKLLGYQPVVAFREAVRRTCAWWHFTQGELSPAA